MYKKLESVDQLCKTRLLHETFALIPQRLSVSLFSKASPITTLLALRQPKSIWPSEYIHAVIPVVSLLPN